jgi:hypothetical protein
VWCWDYQGLAISMQPSSIPFLSLKLIWWLPGDPHTSWCHAFEGGIM